MQFSSRKMVQRGWPRLIIGGENELMRGEPRRYDEREELVEKEFGIIFDSEQCEINLH